MGRIDNGRVLLGGLLAGVIINASEILANVFVFASQFEEALGDLGMPEPTTGEVIAYLGFGFILGITAVWIYAAIRPRFGPGPKTAVTAGLVLWILARVWPITDIGTFLEMPAGLMVSGYVWTLVESVLATMAGAWLYREMESAAP